MRHSQVPSWRSWVPSILVVEASADMEQGSHTPSRIGLRTCDWTGKPIIGSRNRSRVRQYGQLAACSMLMLDDRTRKYRSLSRGASVPEGYLHLLQRLLPTLPHYLPLTAFWTSQSLVQTPQRYWQRTWPGRHTFWHWGLMVAHNTLWDSAACSHKRGILPLLRQRLESYGARTQSVHQGHQADGKWLHVFRIWHTTKKRLPHSRPGNARIDEGGQYCLRARLEGQVEWDEQCSFRYEIRCPSSWHCRPRVVHGHSIHNRWLRTRQWDCLEILGRLLRRRCFGHSTDGHLRHAYLSQSFQKVFTNSSRSGSRYCWHSIAVSAASGNFCYSHRGRHQAFWGPASTSSCDERGPTTLVRSDFHRCPPRLWESSGVRQDDAGFLW